MNVNIHPPDPDSLLLTENQHSQGSKANSHLVLHSHAGLPVSLGMWLKDPSLGPEMVRAGSTTKGRGRMDIAFNFPSILCILRQGGMKCRMILRKKQMEEF